jgi:ABC-type phosphate transport system substrate-binding protein
MSHEPAFARRAALAALLLAGVSRLDAQGVKVVANGSTDVGDVSVPAVAKIFLKQEKKFASGSAAVPVDQQKSAAPRAAFAKEVLGKSVGALEQYWQQQIFSGKDTPPDAKNSDDEVLAFIKSTPGAIGYVSAAASIPSGVKVITLK